MNSPKETHTNITHNIMNGNRIGPNESTVIDVLLSGCQQLISNVAQIQSSYFVNWLFRSIPENMLQDRNVSFTISSTFKNLNIFQLSAVELAWMHAVIQIYFKDISPSVSRKVDKLSVTKDSMNDVSSSDAIASYETVMHANPKYKHLTTTKAYMKEYEVYKNLPYYDLLLCWLAQSHVATVVINIHGEIFSLPTIHLNQSGNYDELVLAMSTLIGYYQSTHSNSSDSPMTFHADVTTMNEVADSLAQSGIKRVRHYDPNSRLQTWLNKTMKIEGGDK